MLVLRDESADIRGTEFKEVSERVGPDNAVDFAELRRGSRFRQRLSVLDLLKDSLHELPQVRPLF